MYRWKTFRVLLHKRVTVLMNDCICEKEMLLKSFVYTDAERERIKRTVKMKMMRRNKINGKKRRWR